MGDFNENMTWYMIGKASGDGSASSGSGGGGCGCSGCFWAMANCVGVVVMLGFMYIIGKTGMLMIGGGVIAWLLYIIFSGLWVPKERKKTDEDMTSRNAEYVDDGWVSFGDEESPKETPAQQKVICSASCPAAMFDAEPEDAERQALIMALIRSLNECKKQLLTARYGGHPDLHVPENIGETPLFDETDEMPEIHTATDVNDGRQQIDADVPPPAETQHLVWHGDKDRGGLLAKEQQSEIKLGDKGLIKANGIRRAERYLDQWGDIDFREAAFDSFSEIRSNYEHLETSIKSIFEEVYCVDDTLAIAMWKQLLSIFEGELNNGEKMGSITDELMNSIPTAHFQPVLFELKTDKWFRNCLFLKSGAIGHGASDILWLCIRNQDLPLFKVLMDTYLQNESCRQWRFGYHLDQVLEQIIGRLSASEVGEQVYALLFGYVSKIQYPMRRKAIQMKLEDKYKDYQTDRMRKQQREQYQQESKSRQGCWAEKMVELNKQRVDLAIQRAKSPLLPDCEYLDLIAIAGTQYMKSRQEMMSSLKAEDEVKFVREATNTYDSNAILVTDHAGSKLGYIPRKDNAVFAGLLDHGIKLFGKVYSVEMVNEDLRILVEIYREKYTS